MCHARWRAIEVSDDTARFAYEQHARGHVPRREHQFPEGVEPPAGDSREIQRRGSGSPYAGGRRHHAGQLPNVWRDQVAVLERKTRADQCARRLPQLRHGDRCAIELRPGTKRRREQLIARDVEHHGGAQLAVDHGGDRYGVGGEAMQKVRRPVEGIGDKDRSLARNLQIGGRFLPDQSSSGSQLLERYRDYFLRRAVDVTDEIRWRLLLPRKRGDVGGARRDDLCRRICRFDGGSKKQRVSALTTVLLEKPRFDRACGARRIGRCGLPPRGGVSTFV